MSFANYLNRRSNEEYMDMALKLAEEAKFHGDFPVGAVLVFPNGKTIGDRNTVHTEGDFTNHAEMNVLRKAAQTMFRKLKEAVLYTTLEPCPMCAAAAAENGIREMVFGAYDLEKGFSSAKLLTHEMVCRGGVLAEECRAVIPERLQENVVIELS